MAKTLITNTTLSLLLPLTILTLTATTLCYRPPNEEKLTRLHFFLHDVVSGPNRTTVTVAEPTNSSSPSSTFFRNTVIMDDPLTEGPDPGSKRVGQAQGMYAVASQSEFALMMTVNFVFTEGEFGGSSVSVVGRNAVLAAEREMPVVGGTGAFRLSRGYALVRTRNFTADYAVMEYNVHVWHY